MHVLRDYSAAWLKHVGRTTLVVVVEDVVCNVVGRHSKTSSAQARKSRIPFFVAWEDGRSRVRKHIELYRVQILKYAHIISLL